MERYRIEVHGIVQGVGLRPFIYQLATRHELCGFVRNDTGGVVIDVEGAPAAVEQFITQLRNNPPPLARIERLLVVRCDPLGHQSFTIQASAKSITNAICVSPDIAVCQDCLAELFNPDDRRYRYPFLNCTNCGPRLTIMTGAPYDRERTTLADFQLCGACLAEFHDPANRRFHAQVIACPACGPRLALVDANRHERVVDDPVSEFAAALLAGNIGALKGMGGYHLACDATNEGSVTELRRRKHREEKPFAVMVRDANSAAALCELSAQEREVLESPIAPIVLLRKKSGHAVTDAVAGKNPYLGVMFPSTPLHHLLMHEVKGAPLVMTSGNRSDEPIAHEDEDALQRLAGIADLFLTHNRPIAIRCDDSVTRITAGEVSLIRRSRGHAPAPLTLPFPCPRPILAVGGQLKSIFAFGHGSTAIVSHHLGDLDDYHAFRAFTTDLARYEVLFEFNPEIIVHDAHPDYASTLYALDRIAKQGGEPVLARMSVQHHHAHLASCMAENGLTESVIGVTFDGTGLGSDGTIWGGEFLIGDYRSCRRAAHLRPVRMPGGEQAIREGWRMALAYLIDAGESHEQLSSTVSKSACRAIKTMLERGLHSPFTSSAGRLFDAVAALAGVRTAASYEAQPAMELEWLASEQSPSGVYPFGQSGTTAAGSGMQGLEIDTRPLIRAIARDAREGIASAQIARRFHSTLVELIAAVCIQLREAVSVNTVVLSGGVFLNSLLTNEVMVRLQDAGFRGYRHRLVPSGDGGLSLGQLAIAAACCEKQA